MSFDGGRVSETLESKALEWRDMIERAYQSDPRRTHADLVSMGYWDIAAQLKIDYAAQRLAPAGQERGATHA